MKQSKSNKLLYKFIFQLNEAENQSGQPLDESSIDELVERIIERLSVPLLDKSVTFLDLNKISYKDISTFMYNITYEVSDTVNLKLLIGIKFSSPKYCLVRSELNHKNPSEFSKENQKLTASSNQTTRYIKSFKNLEEDLYRECLASVEDNINIYGRLNENRNLDKEFEANYIEALKSKKIVPVSKQIKKITNPKLVAQYNLEVSLYGQEELGLTFRITETSVSVHSTYGNEFIAQEFLGYHNFNMEETLKVLAQKIDTWFIETSLRNEENYNNYED